MKVSGLYALMLMTGMMFDPSLGGSGGSSSRRHELTDEEIEHLKKVFKEKQRRLLLKQGMKEFSYYGITVIALNEKNAMRKINNILNQEGFIR
jgi:hypothetical protein